MLAHEVITKVPSSYKSGVESGDLLFFPTTISTHTEAGIEVCPIVVAVQREYRI
jgi:hypothetical protein